MPGKGSSSARPDRRGYGNNGGTGPRVAVRYGETDAELLRECVDAVTEAGDAIIFGRTSDAGAFVVRVKSDAGDGVWYPPTAEALVYVLTSVIDTAKGL